MATLRIRATAAGAALTEIAGRISPAPESLNGDLVRAEVLDTLPFMAAPTGTSVIRTGDLILVDTSGADDDVRITHDPDTGDVVVSINGVVHRFAEEEAGNIVVRTNGGDDVIEVLPGTELGFVLLSGAGSDVVAGAAGDDVINAGTDDDVVVGGQGDDLLDGSSGSDVLQESYLLPLGAGVTALPILPRGGGGDDILVGGRSRAGGDQDASDERNRLVSGEGDDRVFGSPGDDTIDGGTGNDTIDGRSGADSIDGGAGADIVSGGDGDDVIDGDEGDDTIDGGAGNDTIDGGTGDDVVSGGTGDDTLQAGAGDDTVDGGDGRDYIDGYTGDDSIDGGDGRDTIYAGEGDDTVDGGADKDYIDGYLGDDTIHGSDGNDVISGGAGDDTLHGDRGADTIYTGDGSDVVIDRQGGNTVYRQDDDKVHVNDITQQVTIEIATVPANIHVEGSPQFRARVLADLQTLAASPAGQEMLRHIGALHDTDGVLGFTWSDKGNLTIRETGDLNGYAIGGGDDAAIEYNPSFHTRAVGEAVPITTLFHEMAHTYDFMSGNTVGHDRGAEWYVGPDAAEAPDGVDAADDGRVTFDEVDRDDDGDIDDSDLDLNGDGTVDGDDGWTPNLERQAAGLPVDDDGNPTTPDVSADQVVDHPDTMTENALLDEMNYPPREHYR
jgi:Ca2+-binding RTX toxin-like protein